jgi:hypothetical protein
MEGLERVDLVSLLRLGRWVSRALTPGAGPPVTSAHGAVLTLLSGRIELWEATSVAVAFSSQVDADPAVVLDSLGRLATEPWPGLLPAVASDLAAKDGGVLAQYGFGQWVGALPDGIVLTPTSGLLAASRVITAGIADEVLRSATVAMGNLEVCVEKCQKAGNPPGCLLECLGTHTR